MTHTDTVEAPTTDERDPAMLVPVAIDEVLRLAGTWLARDGAPRFGEGNAWTPHKALRRVNDHLLDHLAEIDALLAGAPTVADSWHGRAVTLDTDWGRFTEADLDEGSSRLRRYAELYRLRLADLSKDDLDRARPAARTIRQIAHHVANIVYYARQLGDLTSHNAATACRRRLRVHRVGPPHPHRRHRRAARALHPGCGIREPTGDTASRPARRHPAWP